MKITGLVVMLGILCLAASAAHAGTVVLRDTFETGPAGTPDLGVYLLFSPSPINSIVDDGSGTNKVLASAPVSAGFIIQTDFNLTTSARVEYDFRVLSSGASLIGTNAINQQMVLDVSPNNVTLNWAADGYLWTNTSTTTLGAVKSAIQWAYDTDYHLIWTADAGADTVDISISGLGAFQFAASDGTLGGGTFTDYKSFSFTGNFASTFTQYLDNLVVTDLNRTALVPLPGAVWAGLGLFGLLGAGRFVRRRRR